MAGARTDHRCWTGFRLAALVGVLLAGTSVGFGQGPVFPSTSASPPAGPAAVPPGQLPPPGSEVAPAAAPAQPPPLIGPPPLSPPPLSQSSPLGQPGAVAPSGDQVADVRVVGLKQTTLAKVLPYIKTRPGRPYQMAMIEEDVRRLNGTKWFVSVKPYSQRTADGWVIVYEVLERPVLHYVYYVGNEKIHKKTLAKEAAIKPGDAMDPYAVQEARRKVEEYYRGKGFPKARVTLVEGNEPTDRGAIFLINEGPKQKILWTGFVGNTIASDGRLTTQVQSKPGILWLFKGNVDRKQIEEDRQRLTAYYRDLGFFDARIGRIPNFNEGQDWLTLTYVIDEGLRYKVRGATIVGNTKFATDQLMAELKLKSGDYFNLPKQNADVAAVTDKYGSVGYVFADVKVENRFLDQPGQIDLVYSIKEGQRCRVGKINVHIAGEYPHTRITTVLNRLSLRPGDIVDIRELRASERRLRSSGLFKVDPTSGTVPKIAFSLPEPNENEWGDEGDLVAQRPDGFRGQSPGSPSPSAYSSTGLGTPLGDRTIDIDLNIDGQWADDPPADAAPSATPPSPGQGPYPQQAYPAPAYPSYPSPPQAAPPQAMPAPPMIIRGQSPSSAGSGWQPRWVSASPSEPAAQPAPQTVTATYQSGGDERTQSAVYWASPSAAARTPAPVVRAQYTTDQGYATPPLPTSQAQTPPPAYAPPPPAYAPPPVYAPPVGASAPLSSSAPSVIGAPSGVSVPPPSFAAPPPAAYTAPSGPVPIGAMPPAQPPVYANPYPAGPPLPSPGSGSVFDPNAPLLGAPPLGGPDQEVPLYIPLNPNVQETETGRLMFSVGVNSEAGLIGSVVLDEQNFDWTRWPTSWADVRNGTAFRGAGQQFRMEAVPGTQVQRYAVDFREPYLLDTQVSLGLSGFYFTRIYNEYTDRRFGGRAALGYQFSPDLSGTVAFRGANVNISHPTVPTPPEILAVLGDNQLYGFSARLAHDTRDNQFLATEGHLFEIGVEEVIGTFQYPRADVDFRRYFMLHERPDGSGRHVLSLRSMAAVTGEDTPVYENFYAGGFSTIRGFDFRGASPRTNGVVVGGHFELLASAEYLFPITADDMIRGVFFCDSGTVEPSITDWRDDYRVALGFGLRITIPAMGPAPIALDLAVPVAHQKGDEIENFSFNMGFLR